MAKIPIPKTPLSLSFNAPVTLGFAGLCLVALLLNFMTGGLANKTLFSCYRSSLLDPFTYIRFFGHVIGHANWQHFAGNMMMFLVLGPNLEARYGSKPILQVILVTAVVVGLLHFLLFPKISILGASGVVFAFILLSSFGQVEGENTIPITLILVLLMYLGTECWKMFVQKDNVSQLSHILGGLIGGWAGFLFAGML